MYVECYCVHVLLGCTFNGSSAEVSRHILTCRHNNLQLDANSQQVLFMHYAVHSFATKYSNNQRQLLY